MIHLPHPRMTTWDAACQVVKISSLVRFQELSIAITWIADDKGGTRYLRVELSKVPVWVNAHACFLAEERINGRTSHLHLKINEENKKKEKQLSSKSHSLAITLKH